MIPNLRVIESQNIHSRCDRSGLRMLARAAVRSPDFLAEQRGSVPRFFALWPWSGERCQPVIPGVRQFLFQSILAPRPRSQFRAFPFSASGLQATLAPRPRSDTRVIPSSSPEFESSHASSERILPVASAIDESAAP